MTSVRFGGEFLRVSAHCAALSLASFASLAVLAVAISATGGCAVNNSNGENLTRDSGDGGFTPDGTGDGLTTDGDTSIDPDGACAAVKEEATLTPLDLFVMLDKSSSMAGTKWDGAKKGLKAFLEDPASAGLRVAINFFPRDPDATPSCDQPAYKIPKVAFGDLPGNAAPILDYIAKVTPDGFSTPIYPALGGGILGAIDQVKSKPGDRGAVLLVTDGEPQGPAAMCGTVKPEDPKAIADLAATGFKFSPSIITFVVGLPGVNVATANTIAAAGGSDKAVLVTDPTNIEKQFADALASVRGHALPCEFPVPSKVAKGEISFGLVNVTYTDGKGVVTTLLQSPDCAGGSGWHYDNAAAPTKIILCPATCATIRSDFKAKIEILLGCKTLLK